MIRRSTMKWAAPVVFAGVVIAGGSAAIGAAPWNNGDQSESTDSSFQTRPSKGDIEARRAEMEQRLAGRVESGEITQAEADDIRAKMAERKPKLGNGRQGPSKGDIEARRAEMEQRLARRVESGEITQAEADDIRAKMAERKPKLGNRKGNR